MWLYANAETAGGQEAIELTRNLGCEVLHVSNDHEPRLLIGGAIYSGLEQIRLAAEQDRRFARPIGETAPINHSYVRFAHGVGEEVDPETARRMREAQIRTTNKIELTTPAPSAADAVNPKHYSGDLVMRIIERFKLGFCLGNVVKYVLRHDQKNGLEDLKKARWYLDREIAVREGVITKTVE